MTTSAIITAEEKDAKPLANFAKKKKVKVPTEIIKEEGIKIPPIWYWEDVVDGVSVLMTMAFKIHGRTFGMSYGIEDTKRINILRNQLFNVVKESLDVLVHHGEKVLDNFDNINPTLVNEQEAMRWKFDPLWDKRVAAFNQLVRLAPITKKKAKKLGLI